MSPTYRREEIFPRSSRWKPCVAVAIPVVVTLITILTYCGRMK